MEHMTPDEAVDMGLGHHRAGRLEQAESIYRQVLAAVPNYPPAVRMLGIIASQCGKHSDAITLLTQAAQGGDLDTALDLAVAYRAAGDLASCERVYRSMAEREEPSPKALTAYGQFLKQQGRNADAVGLLTMAAQREPGSAMAQNVLGIALAEQNRFEEASACFRRCIEIDPKFVQAYNNLGTEFLHQKNPAAAEREFRKAIEIEPGYALAYDNLGSALIRQQRLAEALPVLEKAVAIKPEFAKAHESLAWALLALGQWERGFEECEWRLKAPGRTMPREPRWAGEDLKGRTILVHTEAAVVDAIQFARYLPMIAQLGGRVIVVCPRELASVMRTAKGVERVLSLDDPIPQFDVHCSLSSLPHIFRTTPEAVPSSKAAYLSAPAEVAAKWKERLAGAEGRKVGLAWLGDLSELKALTDVSGVRFYRLLKGSSEGENPSSVEDISAEVKDAGEMAGALKSMDLIIAGDTLAAHLAGAMGRPTVLLLEAVADCRWMLEKPTTPWYGSVKLFRQKTLGQWGETVERVKRSLEGWLKKK